MVDPATWGGAGGDALGETACSLRDSPALVVTEAGARVENVFIASDGVPALLIQADGVIVENVRIEHRGAPGIVIEGAADVEIRNVHIEHAGAPPSGVNESTDRDNLLCENSPRLTVEGIRVARGSSGLFLDGCDAALLRAVEGYDFRGPSFRGQLVRFENSPDGVLEEFSVTNGDTSWTENNVHAVESANVRIRRGLIDGNNSPQGHGVLFSGEVASGVVEDVDAIRMGNGCFSAYTGSDDVVFRRTRCRENICTDQGRGLPTSGGIMWSGDENQSNLIIEDSVYFQECSAVVWPESAFAAIDLRESDFTPRDALVLEFCWE